MKQLIEYGIDHIGFLVPDLEAGVAHLKEHYGIQDVVCMEAHIKKREKQTGRQNPIYTNLDWHGKDGMGPFKSSEEAYNTLHIGDVEAARRLQAKARKNKKDKKADA